MHRDTCHAIRIAIQFARIAIPAILQHSCIFVLWILHKHKCLLIQSATKYQCCIHNKCCTNINHELMPPPNQLKSINVACYVIDNHRRTGWGGRGGAAAPPPIRAVCRHELGQRVDIIRAKHNACLNNTNLGSVTAFNGKKTELRVCYWSSGTQPNMDPGKFLLLPPPTEYGSRKISATTPPPTESIRAKLGLPPKWMLARTPMSTTMTSCHCAY